MSVTVAVMCQTKCCFCDLRKHYTYEELKVEDYLKKNKMITDMRFIISASLLNKLLMIIKKFSVKS